MNKKIIPILLVITLIGLTTLTTTTALDKTKNQTIEMNGIKICVPETDQGKITNVTTPQGTITYSYIDDKNKITIYVTEEEMPEYSPSREEWNQYEGYTQVKKIGDKYVMVASEYAENKDFMWNSLSELNPQ